jgi:alkanesulfonate monooxygenase SsuD/methylene tetrahydromethanopterin reductase-like flavin-dependent oxidoreductase (luciferase family)
MRFLVEPTGGATTVEHLVAYGRGAHRAGVDGVFLSRESSPAPLIAASALLGGVGDILVAAEIGLGDRHPLEVAEEAAVIDLAGGGRLILVARPIAGHEGDYAEALDLLRTAWTPRPFRWEGPRWQVPDPADGAPGRGHQRTRVTPAPAGPRVELWGAGAGLAHAARRGLGAVADRDADPGGLAVTWAAAATALGPAALGAPRARRERWTSAAALRERLLDGRGRFGQDWAVVLAPLDAVATIGHAVRPHLQLDSLPPGLIELWAADARGRSS